MRRTTIITITVGGVLSSVHGFAPLPQHRRPLPPMPSSSASISTTLRGGALLQQAALPSQGALAAASLVPTCLGLWKTGYAVSYGYGGAMAASALLYLPHATGVARWHALALAFYGFRLNAFLLCRELFLPAEVHQMSPRDATLMERLKRLPVILGCSLLYFGMAAPLRVTVLKAPPADGAVAAAVAAAFAGFGIAALGDAVKSFVKARRGAGHLVTAFPFNLLRHPNYTGECFGWTASLLAALLAAGQSGVSSMTGWIAASLFGWLGIFFVLAGEAAAGLEKKQREKYGGTPEYEAWIKRSWAGPMAAPWGMAAKEDA